MSQQSAPAKSWREKYRVHPCADVFPISDAEIAELAEDIEKNGLQNKVVLWRAESTMAYVVLDGRTRLDAWERLGRTVPSDAIFGEGAENLFTFADWSVDPAAFVISANIRRRHLTKEARAELIVKTIEAGRTTTNDRATPARSFSPTPAKRGGSTKDPVLATAVTEAKKLGISKRTVQNARAKLHGKTPAPRKKVGGVSSAPPPPSTCEWLDATLTKAHRLLRQALDLYNELNVPLPKLTPKQRERMRARIVADRRDLDRLIVRGSKIETRLRKATEH